MIKLLDKLAKQTKNIMLLELLYVYILIRPQSWIGGLRERRRLD